MLRFAAYILIAAVLLSGCVQASVRKVRNRADYQEWTKDDQLEIDRLCGIRYYLSRPYVVVHKPFPVHSETTLVDGVVSEDGRYVRLVGDLSTLDDDAKNALRHASVAADSRLLSTRTIWRCFFGVTHDSGAAKPVPVPVFTSTNASTSRCEATMSISPPAALNPRARIE